MRKWIECVEPDPFRIAGFNLDKLLLGHCFLMERCAWANQISRLDLWRNLNICSRKYDAARAWLTNDLASAFAFKQRLFINFMMAGNNFTEALGHWLEFFEMNVGTPDIMAGESQGPTLGTPYLQTLRRLATTELNYNPQTVMDAPMGQLIWDVLALNESRGGCRIVDDELAEIFERLKKANNDATI